MTTEPITDQLNLDETDEPTAKGPAPKPRRGARRGPAAKSEPSKRGVGKPSTHDQRAKKVARLHEQYGEMLALGGAFIARSVQRAGEALVTDAERIGEAWSTWADTSPRVARLIDGASTLGGAVGVILAYGAVVKAAMQPGDDDDTDPLPTISDLLSSPLLQSVFNTEPVPRVETEPEPVSPMHGPRPAPFSSDPNG